jgi:heme-degrading monooxygenase HmoA
VIARIWRGWTAAADADEYVEYLQRTGIPAYRATPGNRGAFILRRPDGDRVEFLTLSFWESLEAIKAFAGEPIDRAVFYPEDDRFLGERETIVTHFELFDSESAPAGKD